MNIGGMTLRHIRAYIALHITIVRPTVVPTVHIGHVSQATSFSHRYVDRVQKRKGGHFSVIMNFHQMILQRRTIRKGQVTIICNV